MFVSHRQILFLFITFLFFQIECQFHVFIYSSESLQLVDFTVSYSLLNIATFSFNSSIFKTKFCVHFFCVFYFVRTSHSSLLQSAYCFFFLLSKRRAFHCTCYIQTVFFFLSSKRIALLRPYCQDTQNSQPFSRVKETI